MVKNHLKSLNTPKTWNIPRKSVIYITRPQPGNHSYELGMAIADVLKTMLAVVKTTRDVKQVLSSKGCLVNGVVVTDRTQIVGFMDVVSLPALEKHYRISLNIQGKLSAFEISAEEASFTLTQVIGKTIVKKGKIQINLRNSTNLLVAKNEYATYDTVQIKVPEQKVVHTFQLIEGAPVMLIGGKRTGLCATVVSLNENIAVLQKIEDGKTETFQTLKKFLFVIGNKKPALMVQKKE